MSKAVLLSINPSHCENIVDGKKLLEIRKNKANINGPFKCYIYCTLGERRNRSPQPKEAVFFDNSGEHSNGKVIGEFTCDKVYPVLVFPNGTIQDWNFHELSQACVPYDDMAAYIGYGKTGYAWRISDLVIYEHAKQLDEFTMLRQTKFGGEPVDLKRPPQSWCYVEEMQEGAVSSNV